MPRILIVDDEAAMLKGIQFNLQEQPEFEVFAASDFGEAKEIMEAEECDLVLTDLMLPDIEDGLAVIREAKKQWYNPAVLAMTAFDTVQNAVNAMKAGADDFIAKGFKSDELVLRINSLLDKKQILDRIALENQILKDSLKQQYSDFQIVGESKIIIDLVQKINKIAQDAKSTCLIHGESGTGKDLIARTIYMLSRRSKAPFVPVNCAAIPENLIESEMFGHEKGAFTGANSTKQGKFEQAKGGVIFLDEIGELPLALQVRLLRVLEERSFYRIGGKRQIDIDVMILAATNKDIYKLVEDGRFREDLYYRLNVINIFVPPLRERKEDIRPLALFFLKKFNLERKKKLTISESTLEILETYPFRGNVRELRNILEDAFVFCDDNVIQPENLTLITEHYRQINEKDVKKSGDDHTININLPYQDALQQFEKNYFTRLLERNLWNYTKSAQDAEISLSWFSKKIKKNGIKFNNPS